MQEEAVRLESREAVESEGSTSKRTFVERPGKTHLDTRSKPNLVARPDNPNAVALANEVTSG